MSGLLTALAVWAFLMLVCLAICADSKRREQAEAPDDDATVMTELIAATAQPRLDQADYHALLAAVKRHLRQGGDVDIIGFRTVRHPCGSTYCELYTGSDVVDGAQAILDGETA
jgi:hypothetical protein